MISLHRVLKYSGRVHTDDVVVIPDVEAFVEHHLIEEENDIIEEEVIEKINLVEIAECQAKEILEQTQQRCELMVRQAQDETDAIRAKAWEQGYNEAFESQLNHIADCLTQSRQTILDMQAKQEEYINQYTARLGEFSLEIASAIIKRKLQSDPLLMCDLVENVMSTVKDAKWAVVTLSKQLIPLIELLQSELPAKCPTIANLEVDGKDIPVGKCIVDSPVGLIDASIDEQLENLARRFEQVQQKRGKL